MVRTSLADGPRGGFQPTVRRVFLRACVSIRFVRHLWLLEVRHTVREASADGLSRADGPRVGRDQSGIRGAVLEVLVAFSDDPPCN
jgi:hypothetical protein